MKNPHLLMSQPGLGSSRQYQKGLTLLEMLIAMFLGLIVITGSIQIFIGSKQTYLTQEAASRLQENGRFALDMLQTYIRMAGYRNDSSKHIGENFGNYDVFSEGVIIKGADGSGSGVDADTISIRYKSPEGNTEFNCANNDIASRENTTLQFHLGEDGTLKCTVDSRVTTPTTGPFIDEIRDIEWLYGIDLIDELEDGPGYDRSADTYLSATEVSKRGHWLRVVSVKVALLMSSEEDNVVLEPQTYTYPPLAFDPKASPVTASDRRLYRIFSTTIYLRNTAGYLIQPDKPWPI